MDRPSLVPFRAAGAVARLGGGSVGNGCSLVPLLEDVGVKVEVGEQDEHEDHVTGQQVLTPGGEVARR